MCSLRLSLSRIDPQLVKTAICSQYERLLQDCQIALTDWNEGRAELHGHSAKGKDVDNELRRLQANYAETYRALQEHAGDCEVCRLASRIASLRSRSDPKAFHQLGLVEVF